MKNILELVKPYVGSKIYCCMHGYVDLLTTEGESAIYPIVVRDSHGYTTNYNRFGCRIDGEGECILFPSAENRDWGSPFDLPEGTPVMYMSDYGVWCFGYYHKELTIFNTCKTSQNDGVAEIVKLNSFVIPFSQFDPINMKKTLEYDISKYMTSV